MVLIGYVNAIVEILFLLAKIHLQDKRVIKQVVDVTLLKGMAQLIQKTKLERNMED